MRQLNRNRTLAGLIPALVAGLVSTGCQQPSGPGIPRPLMPANPMSGPTRIPPPPTGSIGGGNAYTQPTPMNGQVSAGLRVNDLVAAAPVPQLTATAPVGTGVLAAGNLAAGSRPVASSPVQQAGFEPPNSSPIAASPRQPRAVATGNSVRAPTIPADAMTAPTYVDTSTPLRPQLRGMQAIDLTPTAPPRLQPVDSGNWAVVGENQQGNNSSIPSTQPIQPSTSKVGTGVQTASSNASTPETASSLQWRRPQAAR